MLLLDVIISLRAGVESRTMRTLNADERIGRQSCNSKWRTEAESFEEDDIAVEKGGARSQQS